VISVHNDLIRAVDNGHVTALVMLDLSSAFDTVDNDVLFKILNERFAVDGDALEWFRSYHTERSQTFSFDGHESSTFELNCRLLQCTTRLSNWTSRIHFIH